MRPDVTPRERGAALLTVLMLVAVIAVIAGTALEKLRLSTRLAGNAAATEQARAFAVAAEALATIRLTDLLGRNPDRVTLDGGWSGRPFALPVPGGSAAARLSDGGNCFNLNGLVTRGPDGRFVTDPIARSQFEGLLRALDLPAQVGTQIAAGTADWIDSDDDQQGGGAEDARYTGQTVGYRTGGTLMADPSELRAVIGVTPQLYVTLKPWICTLPMAQPALINVNTLLPEQAPLLAMLAPGTLSVDAARRALAARPPFGWGDTATFWASRELAGATGAAALTGVKTQWFKLAIDVRAGNTVLEERALIDARRLPAQLVSRQWGEDS